MIISVLVRVYRWITLMRWRHIAVGDVILIQQRGPKYSSEWYWADKRWAFHSVWLFSTTAFFAFIRSDINIKF